MENKTEILLEVKELKKYFPMGRKTVLKAVDGVSFDIKKGETLGVVGESGCGKTTCGRTCIGLYDKTDGEVIYRGKDVHRMTKSERQEFTKTGDWILIYVADYSRMSSDDAQRNAVTAGIDAGLIAQNVYLYGASEGLAVVVHMSLNQKEIADILHLGATQHIVLGQTVGLPAE